MRPVSVSGLAAFSEMVVFSTRPTVCLLSGTMLPAKLVISSTELASTTCWRLLFGNFYFSNLSPVLPSLNMKIDVFHVTSFPLSREDLCSWYLQ